MEPRQKFESARPGVPQRVGKYRLVEVVGRGAMGMVYAAYDDDTDRRVAVKVLMTDLESEPTIRARFYREAQAAARLRHPNVITVYDIGEDDSRPFIVMELLRGHTLDGYIGQPIAIDLERRVDLMIQVCDAMAAAHACGIIHRDLKPGNLFVQSDGLLKVLDFGVARLTSSTVTVSGVQPGTLHFMSPEQARGDDIDSRSDIFSAGGVFYFMLTGRKPFPGTEFSAVFRMLQTAEPKGLQSADSPASLSSIVMRALAKEPANRYQTFHDLAADLVQFRRQYQAETRRLRESAAQTYEAVLAQLSSSRASTQQAGRGSSMTSPVIDRLHEAYPALRDRGVDAFASIPFTRNRVAALQAELSTEIKRLEQHVQSLARLTGLVTAGEQALAEGNYGAALRAFEQAVTESPDSTVVQERLARCRAALASSEADAQRIKALVREAQASARAGAWEDVIDRCDRILAIDRTVPLAVALREAGREAIETARRQAVADCLKQEVAEQIRAARAAFRRGRQDDAISGLQQFVTNNPTAAEAQAEHDRLTALASLQASEGAARAAEVRLYLDVARESIEADALDEAVAAAQRAVSCDPADQEATMLLSEVLEREGTARIERERRRTATERKKAGDLALEVALAAFRRGELLQAFATAQNALRLSPSSAEARELSERARASLASDGKDDAFDEASVTEMTAIRAQTFVKV